MVRVQRLMAALVGIAVGLALVGCKQEQSKPTTGPSGAGSAAAPAPAVVKLTYANFPPASTFPCVQMEHWKSEVEKRTNGQVQIQTFPGGTLLNAKNMYDGVESGAADIGCFAMSYQPGRFPVSEAVDLPLGFTSSRVASLTLFDLLAQYKPKEFEKVKVITAFTCPPVNIMTSKPAKSLADLKGMQLRAAGTGADAVKLLGAVPVAMPQSDAPDAIQKGVVSGIVSSLEVLQDMNYATYCPYVTKADVNVVTFAVVMNKAKWDALGDEAKKVIDEMAREQAKWTGEYVDQHVTDALAWAKEKHNEQIFELSAEEQQKVAELLQPMVDAYVKKVSAAGLDGEQIVKDVREIKAKVEKESAGSK